MQNCANPQWLHYYLYIRGSHYHKQVSQFFISTPLMKNSEQFPILNQVKFLIKKKNNNNF